jgi:hypothetical protein
MRRGAPAATALALALALVLAACAAADLLPPGTPHDATAVFRPASMIADRETAAPGEIVGLLFPDEMTRGVWFVLEQEVGESWTYRYDLTSDGPGAGWQVTWRPAGEEGFAVEDIGVGGRGPDHVVIPDTAEPGTWRICTGNAGENVCVRIEIVERDG